jgi:PIN domain nuclease of toxin-antitoxin system
MILLVTHIWVWWVHNDNRLTDRIRELIQVNEDEGLGVSSISC